MKWKMVAGVTVIFALWMTFQAFSFSWSNTDLQLELNDIVLELNDIKAALADGKCSGLALAREYAPK